MRFLGPMMLFAAFHFAEADSKWSEYDDSVASRGRCSIDIVALDKLTREAFMHDYHLKKPLIVTGVHPLPGPAGAWNSTRLAQEFAQQTVGVGSSRTLTAMGGTGRAEAKLGSIVQYLLDTPANEDADVYAFDRDARLFDSSPRLIQAVRETAHTVFGARYEDKGDFSWYFSLGGRGSGTHLHHHGDGWCYLFEGRKRWFMRSPESHPAISHVGRIPMRMWRDEQVYPKLHKDELPEECEQHVGDLVYVPEGWWHATLNEAPVTLAVAAQRAHGSELTELEKQLQLAAALKSRQAFPDAIKVLKNLIDSNPSNVEAWYMLGIIYGRLRNHDHVVHEEEEAKRKAVEYSRSRNCDALINYGNALIQTHQFKPGADALRKATELCSWEANAWGNLAIALEELGKKQEAEDANNKAHEIHQKWGQPRKIKLGDGETLML